MRTKKRISIGNVPLIGLIVASILISGCSSELYPVTSESDFPVSSSDSSFESEVSAPSTESIEEMLEKTIVGLPDILTSVGIAIEDAKEIEKIDDWAQGSRYRFDTHGMTAVVYCNMDNTVNSVRVGSAEIALYMQGYESWQIDNFLLDESVKVVLQNASKDLISDCLNYPASADFPWLDWAFIREFNLYTVSSSVEAQNAFGVKEEIPFTVKFYNDNDVLRPVLLIMNGTVIADEMDSISLPERKAINGAEESSTTQTNEIRIVDEQLGSYGEIVKLDSYDYYWYHVPAGKYMVKSNTKWCKVYVDKNEIKRNSSGYVEMENVITVELSFNEEAEIIVGEDEHIFLTVNADITLCPIS